MIDNKKYSFHLDRQRDINRGFITPFDLYSHGYLAMSDKIEDKNRDYISKFKVKFKAKMASDTTSREDRTFYKGQMDALLDAQRVSKQHGVALFTMYVRKKKS